MGYRGSNEFKRQRGIVTDNSSTCQRGILTDKRGDVGNGGRGGRGRNVGGEEYRYKKRCRTGITGIGWVESQ